MILIMILNRLAQIMGEKRMDCRDIVKLTKLDNHTVNKLFKGTTKRIEFDTLDELCFALDCEVGDILKYVPNK